MKPASVAYHAPTVADEGVLLLAKWGPQGSRILADGPATMAFRMARPAHLIDINDSAELASVTVIDGVLRIGACVRHAAFDTGTLPGAAGALLRKVVRHIAHYPIRAGTMFCGSVANADPASEWCPVMAAPGGVVVLRCRRGRPGALVPDVGPASRRPQLPHGRRIATRRPAAPDARSVHVPHALQCGFCTVFSKKRQTSMRGR
jgi:CO/xanthine dehydrogenase FAD-binding subunit